jgi:4-amino-4-deoxy-L-arabinose transferase-like glycosyltransferase
VPSGRRTGWLGSAVSDGVTLGASQWARAGQLLRSRAAAGRSRAAVWRSPEGDPAWARPVLLVIAAAAAASYSWGIQRDELTTFYAGAVRSMSQSWRLFFFGGFDPAGWMTLDKLPGAFWVQALSVRLFGFSAPAVIGPQVVEGLLTVLVTYRAVRRFAGPAAALIAAAVVTTMPVSTALSHGNVSDALSTLLLVLVADAGLRAIASGRLRSLICSGVWVGLAFQAKMIQAWFVLPVIGVVYLLAAAPRLRARIGHVAIASVIAVAVSLSWMTAVSLVPATHRPWFDGSAHNSVFEQVFFYNGFGRLEAGTSFGVPKRSPAVHPPVRPVPLALTPTGHRVTPGAGRLARPSTPPVRTAAAPSPHRVESVAQIDTRPSLSRMFYGGFALGVGWLLPLALMCGLLLTWTSRGRPRTDLQRAAVLMWLGWTAGHVAVFSVLYHLNDYYTAVLVPGIGALVGAGAVWAWRAAHESGRRWVAPVALAGSTGYTIALLHVAGGSWSWLAVVIAIIGGCAVGVTSVRAITAARGTRRWRTVSWGAAVLAIATLLVTPAVGSLAMDTHDAGPTTFGFALHSIGAEAHPGEASLAVRYGRQVGRLLGYLAPRVAGERYLLATTGSDEAAPIIAATGRAVLPIGGYLATLPVPSLAQIRQFIAARELRFVAALPHSHDPRIRWVERSCLPISGFTVASQSSRTPARLYDCARRPRRLGAARTPESCEPARSRDAAQDAQDVVEETRKAARRTRAGSTGRHCTDIR